MNIVVCVKQVPEPASVDIDPETGTLVREGVAAVLNPFCEYALDLAVDLKQACADTRIIAVSMGPPQARAALTRCLELGADEAVLASDRRFAGADTWSTARILAGVVRAAVPDFDLILVGKQAVDGDTAQVGPELAEFLGLPQITNGVKARIAASRRKIQVKQEVAAGYDRVEMRLPGLVSVSRGRLIRRLPSLKDVLAARRKPVSTVCADNLEMDKTRMGLAGSLTRVVALFAPPARSEGVKLENMAPEAAARALVEFLETDVPEC